MKNPLLEKYRSQIKPEDKADMDATFAIANRIHELLVKRGMTQKDLAIKLNKKEAEVSKWLTGSHNFTISTLNRIGYAIGEPVYALPGAYVNKKEENIHILFSTILRTFQLRLRSYHAEQDFKRYPERELSKLKVTANGIVSEREKAAGVKFKHAALSPESLKEIEKYTNR